MKDQNGVSATEDKVDAFLHVGEAYKDQWELVCEFMSFLDIRLYYLYKYHMWVGPQNGLQNMMGLVVSREEFEFQLSKAVEAVVGSELADEEIDELEAIDCYFSLRLRKTIEVRPDLPVLVLVTRFGLDLFETSCVLLGFSACLEKKYEKIFAYLQDDVTKKCSTIDTFIHLFAKPHTCIEDYYDYFTCDQTLSKFFLANEENAAFFDQKLNLRKNIKEYLLRGNCVIGNWVDLFDDQVKLEKLSVNIDILQHLEKVVTPLHEVGSRKTVVVFLKGMHGSGRRFLVKHCVQHKHGRCLMADLQMLLSDSEHDFKENLYDLLCCAVFEQAYLCFYGFEALLETDASVQRNTFLSFLNDSATYFRGTLFLISEETWKETGISNKLVKVDIVIPSADENQRLVLWNHYTQGLSLDDDVHLEELSSKFRFTPGQIHNSIAQAANLCELHGHPVDSALLHRCCYEQIVMRLDTLATKVQPAYGWDDLILPQDQLRLLREACYHVRYRHKVFHEWGYGRKITYGGGLSMLFSGPPGTGKTLAAQVVANNLHMEMYQVQLSQIVSKYIGETEKNLRQVFNEAKNANCILFFDETDALFGKRSEIKDSHDRNANVEVAYLLQQMEEYDGVVIMATNLLQNIDAAFMRRINFVITFPFPDEKARLDLWKQMLDTKVPVADDVDLGFMARQFQVAGGNIKNIVLHAAFLAAADGGTLTMAHLLRSTVNEQRKNNVIIVKEDLKEYADLIFKS